MKRFLVSAVARVMNPGCKVDTVLVLVGKQGAKKSTFFAELAKGWFLDSAIDIHSKDAYEQLRRGWIIEWSELEALRRSRDASAIKAFVTSQVDVYRPAYGRVAKEHPRQCVFVGTTNDQEFLSDPTGNRRWWPLAVKDSIDIKTLRAIRDQIWAEAVELYLANEQHWLTDEEEAAIQPERQRHMVSDLWEKTVIGYAAKEPKVYVRDVLIEGLEMEEKDITKIDQMRVADILKNHGFLRHRSNGQTFWTPQGQTKSS
jgi:predicted P-loop ATPase